MRATQLATLRAIQAGADTVSLIANQMSIPRRSASHRVATLRRDGYVERYGHGNTLIILTSKATDLIGGVAYFRGAPVRSVADLFDALNRSLKKP